MTGYDFGKNYKWSYIEDSPTATEFDMTWFDHRHPLIIRVCIVKDDSNPMLDNMITVLGFNKSPIGLNEDCTAIVDSEGNHLKPEIETYYIEDNPVEFFEKLVEELSTRYGTYPLDRMECR